MFIAYGVAGFVLTVKPNSPPGAMKVSNLHILSLLLLAVLFVSGVVLGVLCDNRSEYCKGLILC